MPVLKLFSYAGESTPDIMKRAFQQAGRPMTDQEFYAIPTKPDDLIITGEQDFLNKMETHLGMYNSILLKGITQA